MAVIDLERLIRELADELDDVEVSGEEEGSAFSRGGIVFARAEGGSLEVRLPPDIAEAATRTPDTSPASERGFIRFTPGSDERHVKDRAEAWFTTAWRHAGPT